jgi:protein tyrosine phosphatase (PTP) superfamily phosphohydrolase (DUF442 family)
MGIGEIAISPIPSAAKEGPLMALRKSRASVVAVFLFSSAVAVAATDITGIDRFHQVGPKLYRGAQPSDAAYPQLAKLGVTTVLDLRRPQEHSTTAEARQVEAAGMHYVNVPMTGWTAPTIDQIDQVRAVMDTGGVVFVHCKQGRDRTGTVTAIYRMEREGWANDKALAEARNMGLRWYFSGLNKTIRSYKVDPALAAKYASAANAAAAVGTPAVVLSTVTDSTAAATAASSQDPK